MWKLLPENTLAFKKENVYSGKKPKDRISVLNGASMTGEKLPLLVIGPAKKPRCFKGVSKLPVSFKANRKSWMTSLLFEEWLRKLDHKMKKHSRKIILIVDNFPAHPRIQDLENVELMFLPPNTASKLQPMDGGIIYTFKLRYKKKILLKRLASLEANRDLSFSLLDALYALRLSWDSIPTTIIVNCFHHCHFRVPSNDEVLEQDAPFGDCDAEEMNETGNIFETIQMLLNIPTAISFKEYIEVEDQFEVSPLLTDKEIIESMMAPDDMLDDEVVVGDAEEIPPPSINQILDSLFIIQTWAKKAEGVTLQDLNVLIHLENLALNVNKKTKQTVITEYFSKS